MVTSNIETDLDITNGAHGEIVDIILHPDEPTLEDGLVVKLKYLPSYVLVKLTCTRASQPEGLDEGIIPVEVATQNFQIKVREANGKYVTRSVHRRQYPMTAAYGFTDYRSQGQTLRYVIVDIAKPPSGGLDLFNLYVALSRSSGHEMIWLLRDFDDQMFLKTHDVALLVVMCRAGLKAQSPALPGPLRPGPRQGLAWAFSRLGPGSRFRKPKARGSSLGLLTN
ncbi:hypothetical protein PILCRDRAFT_14391 [Piloderma croceum F 1598]|uniref:Uncharacterized protein n=1 Tax=Piloderma croceum (strain F 1598) TaxID=765440 RepID=A0A0C3F3H3_PILCF|nr:hypothetical protein PILCRDRAFT_14391 [Piloderma croceum F 1598]